jgi:hypothetical protein
VHARFELGRPQSHSQWRSAGRHPRVRVPPPQAFGKSKPAAACSRARACPHKLTAEPQHIRLRHQGGAAFVHVSKDAPNPLISPAPLASGPVQVERTPVRVSTGHSYLANSPAPLADGPVQVKKTPVRVLTAHSYLANSPATLANGPVQVKRTPIPVSTGYS